MAKYTADNLTSLQNETSAITNINGNFDAVETAFENTLSRDGTSPNEMEADLDMNGNHLLNLAAPSTDTEPLRVADIEDYIEQINGTGGAVLNSPGAGEVNKIAKVASAGIIGYTNIEADGSYNLHPTTNNTGALGTATKSWADLFLASGGVINFNNGNYTITHSSGNLAFSGATTTAGTTTTTGIASFAAGIRPTVSGTGTIGSGTLMFDSLFLKSGGVINFNNGDVTLTHSSGVLTCSGTLQAGNDVVVTDDLSVGDDATISGQAAVGTSVDANAHLKVAAGTMSLAPIKLTAGTNTTTAQTGGIEYDGNGFYATPAAGGRGSLGPSHYRILSSDYTLTSTTSAQAIFGTGTLTVNAATTYEVELYLHVTGMSATTGNASLDFLGAGSATLTSSKFWHLGLDAAGTAPAITSGAPTFGMSEDNTTAVMATNATTTNMIVAAKGIMRVNAAGTIIPSIALVTAAAAVVRENSYIKLTPIGTNTVATVGDWA